MGTQAPSYVQLHLFHIVENDDLFLEKDENRLWYHSLRNLQWEDYRELAAKYYEQLYEFNVRAEEERHQKGPPNPEKRNDAQLRLALERPTGGNEEAPVLYTEARPPKASIKVEPKDVRPGVTPIRLAGKKPKCFFALFRAFVGISLMGRAPEVDEVAFQLENNPAFARACGFTLPDSRGGYRMSDVPSRRKLQQFDQIMTESGLWSQAKWTEVARNLEEGVVKMERELVEDTTHFRACSQFETVTIKEEEGTGKGKEKRKSQSKTIKSCRCENRENCEHPWELADDGAGTIVKQKNQKHWGHKAAVVGYPREGVPLDAVAVTDAATHDGETLVAHMHRLHAHLPEVVEHADRALADSAYNSQKNRDALAADPFNLRLCASVNPRRRKTLTEGLPRGLAKITPYGDVVCQAGHSMEYLGVRSETGRYIYGPPRNEEGEAQCPSCPLRDTCLKSGSCQRRVTIPFDCFPHIDPTDPPMAKRFSNIMKRRPSVERMIKVMKCDYGDGRAHKRGNAAFQALLDKTMIAIHIRLRHEHE
jgi:hypothetical protein